MIDLLIEKCETGPLMGNPIAMVADWTTSKEGLASVLVESNGSFVVETFTYAGSFWKVAESNPVCTRELGMKLLKDRAEWIKTEQIKKCFLDSVDKVLRSSHHSRFKHQTNLRQSDG